MASCEEVLEEKREEEGDIDNGVEFEVDVEVVDVDDESEIEMRDEIDVEMEVDSEFGGEISIS